MIHRITKKHHRPIGFLLIFVGLLVAILSVLGAVSTNASSGDNVYGAAWSSTVGWIAFNNCDYDPAAPNHSNCPNNSVDFGVKVDATSGNITGAAWSSNIGWVSFNPSDTSQCGTSAKVSNIQDAIVNGSSPLVGWARALNPGGGQNGDGFWNGCLSLNNSNHGWSAPYRVTLNYSSTGLSTLTGEAWGDEVLGWVSFSGPNHSVGVDLATPIINPLAPQITFTSNPNAILAGQASTLTWTTQNISSCSKEGATPTTSPNNTEWPQGPGIAINGFQQVHPTVTTTYEIECFATDQVAYPAPVNAFATVTIIDPTTTVQLVASFDAPPNFVEYNGGYNTDLTWWTTLPGLQLDQCSLHRVGNGNTQVPYNASLSAGPGHQSLNQPVYPPPSQSTTYQLIGCENPLNGMTYDSNIVTLRPAVPNPSVNITGPSCVLPAPNNQAYISWTTNDVTPCTLSDSNIISPLFDPDTITGTGVHPDGPTTTYTLSCTSVPGGTPSTVSDSTTITVSPTCVSFCVANPTDPSCINPNPDPRPIFEEF